MRETLARWEREEPEERQRELLADPDFAELVEAAREAGEAVAESQSGRVSAARGNNPSATLRLCDSETPQRLRLPTQRLCRIRAGS